MFYCGKKGVGLFVNKVAEVFIGEVRVFIGEVGVFCVVDGASANEVDGFILAVDRVFVDKAVCVGVPSLSFAVLPKRLERQVRTGLATYFGISFYPELNE